MNTNIAIYNRFYHWKKMFLGNASFNWWQISKELSLVRIVVL